MSAPQLVDDSVRLALPIRTVSETNQREHWSRRHKRRRAQRLTVALTMTPLVVGLRGFVGLNVMLTRIAPRELDDDNLRGALKAVRDGVADALGIDDGDRRVTWLYGQGRGTPRAYGVEVQVWRPR